MLIAIALYGVDVHPGRSAKTEPGCITSIRLGVMPLTGSPQIDLRVAKMDESEIIRKLTPRLILAHLETVQCFLNDLEETTIAGEPLELTQGLKDVYIRLTDLAGQTHQLIKSAQLKADLIAIEAEAANKKPSPIGEG